MVHQERFQSTLPRGERRMTVQIFQILAYFNPRSREGSDQNLRWKISAATEISIHAPARGATYPSPLSKMVYNHFNPRSREGSDYDPLMVLTAVTNFNPRSREGSDICSTHCQQDSYIISIHAPARGATLSAVRHTEKIGFQSTLPRGERLSRRGTLIS